MSVKLQAPLGGSVELSPANTASNYTLTVPAQTGTVVATDSSGNVGIGVTPSAATAKQFEIGYAGQGFSSRSGILNTVINATYNSGWKYAGTGAVSNFELYNGTFAWYTAASGTAGNSVSFTQAMALDSSGNLLVGTTSAVATEGGFAWNTGGQIYIGHATGTGSGTYYAGFRYGSNTIGRIEQNGTTAVSYVTSSDYRLKENIAPMTGALDKVAQLKPCTYTWKSDGSNGQGFIAHELAEVCPDAVNGEKDAVDEEGNIKPQGIDTSFLVATLTAAIQEQQAIITELKTRIEALESK